MGLAAIDYIIHCDRRPSLLVVTGRTQANLDRAAQILPVEEAAANGIRLVYLNTRGIDAATALKEFSDGKGYDDILVFTPAADMVEMADSLLGDDGCLNFFAGPSDPTFSAKFNFYNVHYAGTHVVGTSGGNKDDMLEVTTMTSRGLLNPAILITHIGGLDAAGETTLQLPTLPGGKKLIYTGIDMPLTAIQDFGKLGESDPLFARLHEICQQHNGLWCTEAEQVLLKAKTAN
jgi:threonine dehydrogenase-like Zn-dependent dehydrogenase